MKKYYKYLDKYFPDLSDKHIIVTGANVGIGYYTTLFLSYKKAHVIMACRNIKKANAAKSEILKLISDANIDIEIVDLANLNSITKFVNQIKEKYPQIDILINNAGVYHLPRGTTSDGFELIMGTNYIGTYVLTKKMVELMKDCKNSRIVLTYSLAHRFGKNDLNDFFIEKKYSHFKAYSNSKLAICKMAVYLNEQIKNSKYECKVVLAHPGVCATNLINYEHGGFSKTFSKLGTNFLKVFVHSPKKASLSLILAALKENVSNLDAFGPRGIFEISGYPKKQKISKKAYQKYHELIEFSENLLKEEKHES